MVEFKGKCKGVRLIKRSTDDSHISFQLMTEDDENWIIDESSRTSSYWIDELIAVLTQARAFMQTQVPEENGFGFKFKE
jgi:hypothetical protein